MNNSIRKWLTHYPLLIKPILTGCLYALIPFYLIAFFFNLLTDFNKFNDALFHLLTINIISLPFFIEAIPVAIFYIYFFLKNSKSTENLKIFLLTQNQKPQYFIESSFIISIVSIIAMILMLISVNTSLVTKKTDSIVQFQTTFDRLTNKQGTWLKVNNFQIFSGIVSKNNYGTMLTGPIVIQSQNLQYDLEPIRTIYCKEILSLQETIFFSGCSSYNFLNASPHSVITKVNYKDSHLTSDELLKFYDKYTTRDRKSPISLAPLFLKKWTHPGEACDETFLETASIFFFKLLLSLSYIYAMSMYFNWSANQIFHFCLMLSATVIAHRFLAPTENTLNFIPHQPLIAVYCINTFFHLIKKFRGEKYG